MKALLALVASCLLIAAGCSSNGGDATGADEGGDVDVGEAIKAGDIASQQDRDICEWFALLIEDVNAGEVRGTASAEGGAVGETRYRINNMYGLSLGAHEPLPTAVNNLMAKTRGSFEFEEVRAEVDALRDACAQFGLPVPELQ